MRRFIDQCPEDAKRFDGGVEFAEVHRFHYISVHTESIGIDKITFFP
jgi:hypothetical protein